MLLQINKYHRTATGETTSSVKVEKANDVECYRTAMKQFADLYSAYCADASVIDFTLAIIDPKSLKVLESKVYVSPEVAAVDEPVEE